MSQGLEARLVRATQGGLPLTDEPFHEIASVLGVSVEEVMTTLMSMLKRGAIRRIAAVPNHYAIGYQANGMSVWDVDDALVDACGKQVGALEFVTHCYQRPRQLPHWPYNLFAMVHGHDRQQVEAKVKEIGQLLGIAARGHDVLYSKRILKKTGLRLRT